MMMLALDEVLCELSGEDINEQGLPPGFRFHPTDEELITFYLASKVFNGTFCGVDIAEVDLNRCEPWELPEVAKMGEREWYFFSLRDRKYPTGLRTNRATGAGYWKATGKDREVYSASTGALLGMKKTLVFYKGRAPRGEKTKWVMHEYRLDGDFSYRHTCKEEWVICRIFHKAVDKKHPLLQQLQHGGGQSFYLVEASTSSPTTASASASCSLPPLLETTTPINQNPFQIRHHHKQEEGNEELMINNLINNSTSQSQSRSHHQLFSSSSSSSAVLNGFQQQQSTITTSTTSLTNKLNSSNTTPTLGEGEGEEEGASPESMLFKSLLSHQDSIWGFLKQHDRQNNNTSTTTNTVPKQCKTEANFSHFQLPDAATMQQWLDKFSPNPNPNQNPNQNHPSYQNHHPLFFDNNMDSSSSLPSSISCALMGFSSAAVADTSTVHHHHEMSISSSSSTSAAAFNRTGFHMMLDPPPMITRSSVVPHQPTCCWPLGPN